MTDFEKIFHMAPSAIGISTVAEGRFIDVNAGFCQLTGYAREELIGHTTLELGMWADLSERARIMEQIMQRGSLHNKEGRLRTKNGEIREVIVSVEPIQIKSESCLIYIAHDIAEWKRAEQLLKGTSGLLQAVVQGSPLAIVALDAVGNVVSWNPAAESIFGWRAEEVIGGSVPYVLPGEQAESDALWEQVMRDGLIKEIEIRRVSKDGTPVDIRLWATVLQDAQDNVIGSVGVIADVTDRKQAEEALHKRDEQFRALIENALDIITVLEKDGTIRYESPSLERTLGHRPADLSGRNAFDYVHPDDRKGVAAIFRDVLDHPDVPRSVQFRFRHADDSWRVLEAIGCTMVDERGETCIVINSRDITERQRLEENLLHAQKMEAIGRLAGGVADDFNNLLTAITGYSELMLLQRMDPMDPLRKHAEEIKKAGDRAAELTRQLSAFSRRQAIKPTLLDLNALVINLSRMLERLIGAPIRMKTILDPMLGLVKADAGQIEQVIMNLIVNARDAMPKGGQLAIETRNIEVTTPLAKIGVVLKPGQYVLLVVRDTGIGMDAETQAHIFEPFFTTKEPGGGVGMGLSAVYGIVLQSGGTITVESVVGVGSTFSVYLPRVLPGMAAESTDIPAGPWHGSETILLVEDEPVVQNYVRDVLLIYGYQVLLADSAEQAMHIFEQQGEGIDMLLTDIVMRDVNGRELAKRLRSRNPEIKVLLMSGITDEMLDQDSTIRTDYLRKPFSPNTLARRVRDVLGRVRHLPGEQS